MLFSAYEVDGATVGVMGIQPVRNVHLIRHAYVLPASCKWRGVGSALIMHRLMELPVSGYVLVGTWAAATWAIRFYQRNGFRLVSPEAAKALLLKAYWTIPERQVEVSVVLAFFKKKKKKKKKKK